jgi:DNA polymerase
MDARERLRQYLEQRREMGERELVLDGMSVEDVMRIVGAGTTAGAAESLRSRPNPQREAPRSPREEPGYEPGQEPREAPREVPREERTSAGPPPTDPASADPGSADWREILRSAGGAPARQVARPAPEPPPGGPFAPPLAPPFASPAASSDAAGAPTAPQSGVARPEEGPPPIVVGASTRELFGGPFGDVPTLGELAEVIAKCTRCPLYKTATNPVPGEGSPTAELVCVGEAPGENEDKQGRPFVGQSGQLLTKILAAINLRREDVFICNVLKHRPPANRNPEPLEVAACSPYLVRQLEIIRPKVIVAFGTFAAQTLLDTKLSIGKLRGTVHRYNGIPLVVTYHPAALLRNPAWKRPTWEDVQLARRVLDRAAGA